jgi:hypothetical protein
MSNRTNPAADILARVRFLPTAEGGRKGPTPPNRLGLGFHFDGALYDSFLLLHDIGSISPGDEVVVPMMFLFSKAILLPILKKGTKFKLWEGKDIAEGEVIEILGKPEETMP